MASQCHRLSVHSSTCRFSAPYACSASSSTSCNLRVNQPSVFLRGQRLQSQQLSEPSLSPSSRPVVQCFSSTDGSSSNIAKDRQQNNVTSTGMDKAPESIRAFPWAKAGNLFLRKMLDQFWTVGKWLAIPVLAVSALSELSYTLGQGNILIVPFAMICGIFFAGIIKETALEFSPDIEEGQTPLHLVALGLLFAAFKLAAPYLPTWGQVSVPHFANGGLWQVVKLVSDWRQQDAERKTIEQS